MSVFVCSRLCVEYRCLPAASSSSNTFAEASCETVDVSSGSGGVRSGSCWESLPEGRSSAELIVNHRSAGLVGLFSETRLPLMTLLECYWIVFLWELSAHAHTAEPPPPTLLPTVCRKTLILLWRRRSRRLMHS